MTDLEEKLIEDIKAGKDISLERGLLIVSGLKTEEEIRKYTQKLNHVHNGFIEKLKSKNPISISTLRKYMPISRAKLLFEYLWNTKPMRCNGNFLLTDVIDAQLNPDINHKVGTCIGLTSLYTVLGLIEGLNLTILVNNNHILNRLKVDEIIYNIENTDPFGFNYDLGDKFFVEQPLINLLAIVLNSRGMVQEILENLDGAIKDYDKAIKLNPEFVEAYCNRGIAKVAVGVYAGAIKDFDKAIEINPKYVDAYDSRGIAKERLSDLEGAMKDHDAAIKLYPEVRVQTWRFRHCTERL